MTPSGVAEAVARAEAFVTSHGDALQRARAAALAGTGSILAVEALLGESEPVTLLALLDALGVRRGAAVERAVAALAAAQRDDGCFAVEDDGGEAAAIAATAHVAGLLAKTPCVRPTVLDRAGAWLGARWSPDRAQSGNLGLIAGYASFFANFDHEHSDAGLQWCGRELERGFRTGAFDALAVARVFLVCDAQGLPGARLGADELLLSLLAQQREDGSFPGDNPVEAALDALASLRRLRGRTLP